MEGRDKVYERHNLERVFFTINWNSYARDRYAIFFVLIPLQRDRSDQNIRIDHENKITELYSLNRATSHLSQFDLSSCYLLKKYRINSAHLLSSFFSHEIYFDHTNYNHEVSLINVLML